ncbi:uncharacterized protein KY384_004179 [Bacidia gigantensis]|uniref:uncharacterized protein n=1 Tax=Bacidia gigantensis TaxID=2732470 RepID=UPI001D038BB3|nr:uncharacterized protein KY384_004179 [Bacidia gigantensis]KAG8530822.1 hypothetical protein KY384_004179 [Bacidia gigantensis]
MDTRPRKRQKRITGLNSDDEGPQDANTTAVKRAQSKTTPAATEVRDPPLSLPVRKRAKASKDGEAKAVSSKATSSPRKSRSKAAVNGSPNARQHNAAGSRPISTFFSTTAAAVTRQHHVSNDSQPAVHISADFEEEDDIEDDLLMEAASGFLSTAATTQSHHHSSQQLNSNVKRPPSLTQAFKLPARAAIEPRSQDVRHKDDLDKRPWVERLGPSTLQELAVNKRKVEDVKIWLESVFTGKVPKRLLILKGPSGSGKSTTIDLLAKTMHIDLVEWSSPVGSDFSSEGYTPMSAQLEEFVRQSGRFGGLELSVAGQPFQPRTKVNAHAQVPLNRQKITVLEEFPTNLVHDSTALRSFRSCILQYLASTTPVQGHFSSKVRSKSDPIIPLILILTEIRVSSDGPASDSFTAQRLLGPEILAHSGLSTIDFNVIAPSFLVKALELVLRKEARVTGRLQKPGSEVLKRLSESGDVRSAISSLEFLCVHGHDPNSNTGQPRSTILAKEAMELVTQRESTLGLFHAVGKVVYNKREEPRSSDLQDVLPPSHLSHLAKPRLSEVFPDTLIDETGTDTSTFLAALHENFVTSCEGSTFIDIFNSCLDALSCADLLEVPRGFRPGSFGRYQGAGSDSIKQGEMSFQLAVRGLLFYLPDPVKRGALPNGIPGRKAGKGDAYKMFYPTSARLGRQREEIDDAVDRWIARARMGLEVDGAAETVMRSIGMTKTELLLERLPYIARFRKGKAKRDVELDRITQFRGLKLDAEAGEDEVVSVEPIPGQSKGFFGSIGSTSFDGPIEGERKLYLSDDDIED